MTKFQTKILVATFCFLILPILASAQAGQIPVEEEAVAMIKQIYTEVSGQSDEQVDWDRVSSFFVEDAVIVLQLGNPGLRKKFSG